MLATIVWGVLALVVLLLIVIATRPGKFQFARSTTVAAPADIVFAQLNDLHRWSQWNPFEKSDPSTRITYTGAPSGVGAGYHFAGKKAGEGRMTLVESTPNQHIAVRAEFIKPMAATHRIEFTLKPAADGTSVTWAMSGDNNFLGKAISLFINMDKMIGGEFEKGLADLKLVSEEEARRQAEAAKQPDSAAMVAASASIIP